MNLADIAFPAYLLGKEPITENNVTFFLYRKKNLEDDVNIIKIIDDKNKPGNTLAERRLQVFKSGDMLYNIKYGVYFVGDLIKISKGNTWFIDSNGKVFNYKKTRRVPLVFKKIKKVIQHSAGVLIEVEGMVTRFKTLYAPTEDQKWAGILLLPEGTVLYGMFDKKYDDTVRAV
jgi:hypothetical protein